MAIAVSFLGGGSGDKDPVVAAATEAPQTQTATATVSPSPTAGTSQSAAPTVNKAVKTQILNSTRTQGLAARLSTKLKSAGWTIVSEDSYRKGTPPTTVYYRDAENKATAQELAKAIGGVPTSQTQSWQTPITIMLGADFRE